MTLDDFVELVQKMRKAQQQYFKASNSATFTVAKVLEREVDQAIRELQGLPL